MLQKAATDTRNRMTNSFIRLQRRVSGRRAVASEFARQQQDEPPDSADAFPQLSDLELHQARTGSPIRRYRHRVLTDFLQQESAIWQEWPAQPASHLRQRALLPKQQWRTTGQVPGWTQLNSRKASVWARVRTSRRIARTPEFSRTLAREASVRKGASR